jgi:hypothetical protein
MESSGGDDSEPPRLALPATGTCVGTHSRGATTAGLPPVAGKPRQMLY